MGSLPTLHLHLRLPALGLRMKFVVILACFAELFSQISGQCLTTTGGAKVGVACVFPFTSRGKTYTECTTDGGFSIPWCSTQWTLVETQCWETGETAPLITLTAIQANAKLSEEQSLVRNAYFPSRPEERRTPRALWQGDTPHPGAPL